MKEIRWYQKAATDALMDALLSNEDCHPIVVAPTGSGKTVMICDFIDKYLTDDHNAEVLVLSHVKEILQQDYDALEEYFEGYDIGLYSAGLGSRTKHQITVAGIQSVYKRPQEFKNAGVVIIDECHLVTIRQSGMYRKLLNEIDANFVGFTATHFRLGHGYIHEGEGALFNEIAFNISSPENFNRLVEDGYLTKLITKATVEKLDADAKNVRITAGDYNVKGLSDAFDLMSITEKAVDEIIEFGHNYKKWLIFAIDIDHAENITDTLNNKNINAGVVHSKMDSDRDLVVEGFRNGEYRAIVNVDILTTGLDVPDIDLIAMLRPTQSPVIHVQTIGRGLRVAPGKDHCLVLDFAGNTMRLGPINDPIVKKKGPGGSGSAVVKECPECHALQHAKVKFCDVCGHEFKFKVNLRATAGTYELVRKTHSKPQWHMVDDVTYALHHKTGSPTSLKVTYRIGLQIMNEWVCYDHSGYAKNKANHWVKFRTQHDMPMPKSVFQLLEWAPWLKRPVQVYTNFNDKFPVVKDVRFADAWSDMDLETTMDRILKDADAKRDGG